MTSASDAADARSTLALTALYFSSFAALGIFLPYFNLYLLHRGFVPWQIGIIAAVPALLKIVIPAFFGLAADRTGSRRRLIIVTSAATTVSFSLLLNVSGFIGILFVIILFATAWAPVLPLVEATTLETVDRLKRFDYGRIRVWGSVGFIVATVVMGLLLDHFSDRIVLYGVSVMFVATTAAAWGVPEAASAAGSTPVTLSVILRRRSMPLFYAACILMQLGHGTYYGFFSIALEADRFSTSAIGTLWTIAVVAEVAFMFWAGRAVWRFGVVPLFAFTFVAAAARWGLMAAAPGMAGLIVAQTLHALSFGAFHIAAVTIIHHSVPSNLRATGQTLYSSLAYGVGSGLGLLINGWLYDAWGPTVLFGLSALVSGAGLLLALRFLTVSEWRFTERASNVAP